MIRFTSVLVALIALSSFAEELAKPKLTVMPFASLSGDIPARAGSKALGMLTTEFKSADAFALVESKKDKGQDATAASLENARKLVEEAKGLRAKKKFRLASESLQKALEAYKAGGTGLSEIGEVVDALALQSAVQFNTGRDDEGQKNLLNALALSPDRELPLAATSPLFSKLVEGTRKNMKAAVKGNLLIESIPANTPVMIDAVGMGSTPLLVTDLPEGTHYWNTTLPNGEVVGGTVDIASNKQAQVKAVSPSKDPQLRILGALAQNKIDPDAVAAAKEHAKAAEADLVVFGVLSREGKGLALDSFLLAASTGEVRRLPRTQFDGELLSAGMEFYNLAGEMAKKGSLVGEAVKIPASITLAPVAGGTKVAEAKFGASPDKDAIDVDGTVTDSKTGPRKPLEQKRRAPLKQK
jgi:hypothetical protein